MKIFIPAVGTKLRLTKDWEFSLFFEHRNFKMVNYLSPGAMKSPWAYGDDESLAATLKAGTILIVDRVYIRSGPASAYNSLTFRTGDAKDYFGKKGLRFWAKLDDVNTMDAEMVI